MLSFKNFDDFESNSDFYPSLISTILPSSLQHHHGRASKHHCRRGRNCRPCDAWYTPITRRYNEDPWSARYYRSLHKEIEGVFLDTEGLKAVQPSELESLSVARQSLSAIKICEEARENFRKDLQRWTKHSEDGKMSRRDRINVGFFQKENIKALSTRLQTCKTTLISAVSSATLFVLNREIQSSWLIISILHPQP